MFLDTLLTEQNLSWASRKNCDLTDISYSCASQPLLIHYILWPLLPLHLSVILSFPAVLWFLSVNYLCKLPPDFAFLSSVFFFSVTVYSTHFRGCGMSADRRLSLMTYSSLWRRSELFNRPAKWSSVGAERHVRLIRGQDLPLSCAYTKLQCILTRFEEFLAKFSQSDTFFSTRTVAELFQNGFWCNKLHILKRSVAGGNDVACFQCRTILCKQLYGL